MGGLCQQNIDKFPVYPPLTDYVVGDLQDFQPTPIDPPDEDKCHEDTENVFIVGVNAWPQRKGRVSWVQREGLPLCFVVLPFF